MQTIASCFSRKALGQALFKKVNLSNQSKPRHASMLAWKVGDSLNNPREADLKTKLRCTEVRVPTISAPADLLVKVHSTSINPLDIRMCYGYGRRVLDLLDIATNFESRITNDRYPLTLGRDFSGEVVHCGPYAGDFQPGDQVFGVVEPQRSGAHAEYVTVPSYCVVRKPRNLTHQGAASIPFVGLTAYSALSTFGNLTRDNCSGRSVLILGGSGGVGSFAIQLLKVWGANVTATCAENKIEWLENTLFVDQAICYNDSAQLESLRGRFDFVLDCGNYEGTMRARDDITHDGLQYLKPFSGSAYVTLSPPILSNTDTQGIVLGATKTAIEAVTDVLASLRSLNSARWAVFLPNKKALNYIASLYEDEVIWPQVHSVLSFNQMPEAYELLQSGTVKGKVVVDATQRADKQQSAHNGQHHMSDEQQTSGQSSR